MAYVLEKQDKNNIKNVTQGNIQKKKTEEGESHKTTHTIITTGNISVSVNFFPIVSQSDVLAHLQFYI